MKKSKKLMRAGALLIAVTALVAFNVNETKKESSRRTAASVPDWSAPKLIL
jgi:hypothetical protein